MEAIDRRKNERHRVGGTVWFHWRDITGTSREETGSLRNVSAGGLFVDTTDPPPVGTEVLFQFEFNSPDKSPAVSIKTKGQVSRVELKRLQDGSSGFAASTSRMRLQKLSDSPN